MRGAIGSNNRGGHRQLGVGQGGVLRAGANASRFLVTIPGHLVVAVFLALAADFQETAGGVELVGLGVEGTSGARLLAMTTFGGGKGAGDGAEGRTVTGCAAGGRRSGLLLVSSRGAMSPPTRS